MLRSLTLENFKSFVNEEIPLAPITILVGANASGKSNVFDAIRFLQGIGLEMSIVDILRGRWEGGQEIWPGIRGGISEVAHAGQESFAIRSSWEILGEFLDHGLRCRIVDHPLVEWEQLSGRDLGAYLFDTAAPTLGESGGLTEGGAINVGIKGTGGGRNPRQQYPAIRSLLGQIRPGGRVDERVTDLAKELINTMAGAVFIDIRPARMREYVSKYVDQLGADGHNISAVLYRYCKTSDEDCASLVDWLSELCAPELRDIEFVETDLGDVLLTLIEKDTTRISARSLSDGTLRFLGQLTALKTAPKGSLLLIEEIENSLHPARVHLLVEAMESIVKERDIQVIAITHSPSVLQALSTEALHDAVLFARPPGHVGTVARRLGNLRDFADVVKRRGIEHVFSTGWLERAL